MEKLLLKIARQLNGLDEASLMALWPQYMSRVQNFDGSQDWEEATIVLSLLQAVRSKNQLFNVKLAERAAASAPVEEKPKDIRPWRQGPKRRPDYDKAPVDNRARKMAREILREREERASKSATILQFRPKG
ncbi:MAG: hypothetical protein IJB29_06155 [Mailhella sp.]|nr:hypothetical protein [Mailhella sp.]